MAAVIEGKPVLLRDPAASPVAVLNEVVRHWVDKAVNSPQAWKLANHSILTGRILQQLSGDAPDRLLSWEVYAAILELAGASEADVLRTRLIWRNAQRRQAPTSVVMTKGETPLEDVLLRMQLGAVSLTSETAFMEWLRDLYRKSEMTLRKCVAAMQTVSPKDAIGRSTLNDWLHTTRIPGNYAGLAVLLRVILPGTPTPELIERYIVIARHLRTQQVPPEPEQPRPEPDPVLASPDLEPDLAGNDPEIDPDPTVVDPTPDPEDEQAPDRSRPGRPLAVYIAAVSIILNVVLLVLLLSVLLVR
ncbi:hypothetical protein [Actinokineospora sp. UTMC 2448]|uniref:hypothetical protein n=1 Tax=Actinokineospora sp. UTMC 2448 TaxID=2268449 RepID=UPI0021642945|nr:hypothetical protein [Actinokineospora sp. UTMC 2448]UVS77341.1 hypothetical protein Actkin_01050 [Actinokineospora sp. UTMC 2448]